MDYKYEDIQIRSQSRNFSTGILVEDYIYKSKRIEVIKSSAFGRCLYLDGSLQLTEKDEHIYHECLTHPVISDSAKKVLIIGGGDGCSLREVLKTNISQVTLVDINADVLKVSREHLPFCDLDSSFNDPRVSFVEADGALFIKKSSVKYDVIIVDCPDMTEESASLFSEQFFADCKLALFDEGRLSFNCGNFFIKTSFVHEMLRIISKYFHKVSTFYAPIPSFASGGIGFIFADANHSKPICGFSPELKYLNLRTFSAGMSMWPKCFDNLRFEFKSDYVLKSFPSLFDKYDDTSFNFEIAQPYFEVRDKLNTKIILKRIFFTKYDNPKFNYECAEYIKKSYKDFKKDNFRGIILDYSSFSSTFPDVFFISVENADKGLYFIFDSKNDFIESLTISNERIIFGDFFKNIFEKTNRMFDDTFYIKAESFKEIIIAPKAKVLDI